MKILIACPRSHLLTHPPYPEFNRYQPQVSWAAALRGMGHEVRLFPTDVPLWPVPPDRIAHLGRLGKFAARQITRTFYRPPTDRLHDVGTGRAFMRTVADFGPDFLIVSGGGGQRIPARFLVKILRKIPGILINGMSPALATATEMKIAGLVEKVVCNDRASAHGWLSLGARNVTALPISACDPAIHYPDPSVKKDIDVSFIGSLTPGHFYASRVAFLETLVKSGVDLQVFCPEPSERIPSRILAARRRGPATGRTMVQILNRSLISVNVNGYQYPFEGNLKTFEIPACGALQTVDYARDGWFSADEIVVANSPKKMGDFILEMLADKSKIAGMTKSAFLRVTENHTYTHRFRAIFR